MAQAEARVLAGLVCAVKALKQVLLHLLRTGAVDPDGLAAYWPGGGGTVSLTAWAVQFLVEAKEAGYPVDAALFDKLRAEGRSFEEALRPALQAVVEVEAADSILISPLKLPPIPRGPMPGTRR